MKNFGLILLCVSMLVFPGVNAIAQSKTTKYTYDSLGRLTFVEDGVNGNRDYDYDKAGNRLLVSTNNSTDSAAEPGAGSSSSSGAISAPTGLSYASCCAMGVYRMSWNPVSGATYYVYALTNGVQKNVTDTTNYTPSTTGTSIKPYWVKACNATACSSNAYF